MKKILILMLCGIAAVSVLAGCGKNSDDAGTETTVYEETLQEILTQESDLADSIAEAAESCGMNVQITGNELRFTYTISEEISGDEEEFMSSLFDTDIVQETFEALKDILEKTSGCDITIYVDYVDEEGEVIYESVF